MANTPPVPMVAWEGDAMYRYRSDRGGCGAGTVLGIGLLSAALAMAVVAYSGRLEEDPIAAEARVRRGHSCDESECHVCTAEREWLKRNPGRRSGDLAIFSEEPELDPGTVSVSVYPETDDAD